MVLNQIAMKSYERNLICTTNTGSIATSIVLKEYGKGYSYEQLKKMCQFAKEFHRDEIRLQPATQIPWSTLVIISKSNSHEEMLWYIDQTHNNGWSRSMVLNQIAMKSYLRSLIEPTTTEAITSSNDLREYGKGYSRANLFEMMKFANEFNLEDIIQQPVRQIPCRYFN